jgi:putative endonuclease
MFTVYILYSPTLDRYYIGQTEDFDSRFTWHKDKLFDGSYTSKANDWLIFFQLNCESRRQAVNVERHIKKMKSRNYIENLKKYPEIAERLKLKYK